MKKSEKNLRLLAFAEELSISMRGGVIALRGDEAHFVSGAEKFVVTFGVAGHIMLQKFNGGDSSYQETLREESIIPSNEMWYPVSTELQIAQLNGMQIY